MPPVAVIVAGRIKSLLEETFTVLLLVSPIDVAIVVAAPEIMLNTSELEKLIVGANITVVCALMFTTSLELRVMVGE